MCRTGQKILSHFGLWRGCVSEPAMSQPSALTTRWSYSFMMPLSGDPAEEDVPKSRRLKTSQVAAASHHSCRPWPMASLLHVAAEISSVPTLAGVAGWTGLPKPSILKVLPLVGITNIKTGRGICGKNRDPSKSVRCVALALPLVADFSTKVLNSSADAVMVSRADILQKRETPSNTF